MCGMGWDSHGLAGSAAELPFSHWAGKAGTTAGAHHKSSRVGGGRNRAFPLGREEQLNLGNVREGTRVQVASCSQHLCLMC